VSPPIILLGDGYGFVPPIIRASSPNVEKVPPPPHQNVLPRRRPFSKFELRPLNNLFERDEIPNVPLKNVTRSPQ